MGFATWLQENPLEEHEMAQGSTEWLAFRANHDGSSEAAAAIGISKKTSRTELMVLKSSGMQKEFSEWVQKNILDHGHEVEALARPIIERQIGTKIYPVVRSRGRISASCDGLNMAGTVGWEHKQWNEKLAASVSAGELPDDYMAQPQQCLMVTGAEKWIFTVSDGTEENMVSMEVLPDLEWFERILSGWSQFHKDLDGYVPVKIAERPPAEVSIELPALFVHAKGEITAHNMDSFGQALTDKLAEMRAIALVTDQDFSNAKEAAKKFRETAKAIALSKEAMLSQTETIGEAARKMDAWAKDLNATALQLEKDVEREDMAKKRAMIDAARIEFAEHVEALEAETKPIKLSVQRPDFAEAIKGKRNYASMHDAIGVYLANGKIAADAEAKDVRAKLAWLHGASAGFEFLFSDLATIIAKPLDDFKLLVETRIAQHKQAEAEKQEAERKRIQQEEQAKAEAKVRAKQEAEAKAKAMLEYSASVEHEKSPVAVTVLDPAAKQAAVIENHDDISTFLKSRAFKDESRIRAILCEFVKHQAERALASAA